MLVHWVASHDSHTKLIGWICAFLALSLLLTIRFEPDTVVFDASLRTARDRTDVLLLPLSIAIVLHGRTACRALLFEQESIAILYQVGTAAISP